jgi:UDP-glucose 4-epimerase
MFLLLTTKNVFNKSALILGAAGFIGSRLVNRLLTGNEFESLILAGYGVSDHYSTLGITTVDGLVDAKLLDQCPHPDVVFFAAGGASVGISIEEPALDFKLSIPPLVDLLNKLRISWKGTRLVYISSAAVYGESASISTSVHSTLRPLSPYGLHKKLSEELITFDQTRNRLEGIIVRPFSVYGPGLKKQLLWDALNKAELGEYSFFGTGLEMRDWVFVDDLVSLLVDTALYSERFPSTLNVGTGTAISVKNILRKLYVANDIGQVPLFIHKDKAGDPCNLTANAIEQEAYRSYFNTPLEQGLKCYVDWYRSCKR